ncbi:hypothetical protein SAMN06265222_1384 [Neorhodopirellula lusitana]|uniref:Uncharacterized protein n=2 Tax=Neorhodopirellula lusitana TaxID=445327 RepID=A0ABY1QSW9_9BACT|nr:hypothetical protein SAMN06265222_1384 [Neorhodopirellula lusitana]
MAMASVPTDAMLPVGSAFKPPHEADVFWFPTDQEPTPNDRWLKANFPTGKDCVDGFRSAFALYVSDGCGREMRDKLLSELTGRKLEQFRSDGWLPFLICDRIYINAQAGVIVFKCQPHIDYNLEEHGVEVSLRGGKWHFGYIGDSMDYFDYWQNGG